MTQFSRRDFLSKSLKGTAGLIAISMIPIGFSKFFSNNEIDGINIQNSEGIALPIPPLLENKSTDPNKAEFYLTAKMSKKEFIKGKETNTFGYNGDYLGPVIRVRRGQEVSIKVKNELNEETTVHWHGLEVDGENDGGPHSIINPKNTWNPKFTIDQPAATLWYHPHLLHKTGEQVYKGLAGLFYIDDHESDRLNIPSEYGINDIPLVLQDKKLDANGRFEYKLGMHDVMMGMQGGTLLVNGAINPYLRVSKGKVRFRILNGSNARFYELFLSNKESFYQIGSDGGLLEAPVEMTKLIISPGERAEIIVDFSNYKTGDTIELTDQGTELMKFIVNDEINKSYNIPKKLVSIERINSSEVINTREFVLQGMGRNWNINGKQMDMKRIDEYLKLNDTEIWEVSNKATGMMGGMPHPFHAHGVQFQVIDRNGERPPANESGWKDTILVYPDEKVRLIATFKYSGIFMYHCHILEHEDAGMMGQFKVE